MKGIYKVFMDKEGIHKEVMDKKELIGSMDKRSVPLRLRPHHFLCIQLFTGHGYDDVFTAHMYGTIKLLSDEAQVLVQEGCDDICEKCPNRNKSLCKSFDKVRGLDKAVRAVLGVSYGDLLAWKDITTKVQKEIFGGASFDGICRDCEWYGLCRDTLTDMKACVPPV
jgi:hypothetical protein